MKKLIAFAAVALAALTLAGCSSSSSSSGSTSDYGTISGNLTESVQSSGVEMKVDPSWHSDGETNGVAKWEPSSSCVVTINPCLASAIPSVDSLNGADGPQLDKTWEEDGVTYIMATKETSMNGSNGLSSYLYGTDGVAGFYVLFNTSYDTDGNRAVRDELFSSVKYTPKSQRDSGESSGSNGTSISASTMSQTNALKTAKQYLSTMPFSHDSLIKQLEYEGFSSDDATYAADNCGADWNEQATKSAQSYLDTQSFSRQSLIAQLEYEGYTEDQATHGVDSVEL